MSRQPVDEKYIDKNFLSVLADIFTVLLMLIYTLKKKKTDNFFFNL